MLVYVRPSNETLHRARMPGVLDQCRCHFIPFFVGALRARAPGRFFLGLSIVFIYLLQKVA